MPRYARCVVLVAGAVFLLALYVSVGGLAGDEGSVPADSPTVLASPDGQPTKAPAGDPAAEFQTSSSPVTVAPRETAVAVVPRNTAPPRHNVSGRGVDALPVAACPVGPKAPRVHFEQVKTYVGAVPAEELRAAMVDLAACLSTPAGDIDRLPAVDFFGIDGTLLNLLRWGRIVNDNDIDVGVVARGVPHRNVSEHYFATMRRLIGCGFVDEPSAKQAKKLHNQHKVVKPRRCLLRPQMMQCRHANGVIVDVFGPETVFSALTGLDAAVDVLPTVLCRAFDATFPCPRNSIAALKQFTMQFPAGASSPSTDVSKKAAKHKDPKAWYEFAGCALLPLRPSERDAAHVTSILADVVGLRECGYPSLLADAADAACVELITRAGVALPTTP